MLREGRATQLSVPPPARRRAGPGVIRLTFAMPHSARSLFRPARAGGGTIADGLTRSMERAAKRTAADIIIIRAADPIGRSAAPYRRAPSPFAEGGAWRVFNDHAYADRRTPPGRNPRGGRQG
ncbi:hypothetical protein SPHINGO8AM_210004 [Sphingomonas sp. 8AM]|nr:hypothetical protein SPHINGO8AM_210004 [Sphingomonas sp. 8AM]